jgi:intein-encoded DNA endonuclease-like protein
MGVIVNLDYIAGIIDGEASFIIVFRKDKRYRTGIHVVTRFSLPQKDPMLLKILKEYLGMGSIYFHKRDRIWYYEITSYKSLYKLTSMICDKLILKREKCFRFRKILKLILNKKHLTLEGINYLKRVWLAPETGANPR